MINLIPPDAEKAVRREYRIRILSVWMFLIAVAAIILTILSMPTYFLLRSQIEVHEGEFMSARELSAEFREAESSLKNANTVADTLAKQQDQVLFSTVVTTLETLIPEGVQVENYTFSRKGNALGNITVSGVASGRGSLSAYRSALEAHPLFKTASLPLSNLARDKEIPFSITITPHNSSDKKDS